MKRNAFLLLALAAMFGCSKSEHLSDDDANGLSVQLSSRINDASVTRGDGVIEGEYPESSLDMDIFCADMDGVGGNYPTKWEKKVTGTLLHRGDFNLNPRQFYRLDVGQKSRFAGVYPQGGTYDKETWSVTYNLDGAMDVMCSDIVEGHAGITPDPLLTFKHLLTRIEVQLKAQAENDDPDALARIANLWELWGPVLSIKVAGKKIGAVVTLPTPDSAVPLTDAMGTIAALAGPPEDLPLWTIEGEEPEFPSLTSTATTFGHAMFLPSTANETLDLTITFTNREAITVTTPTSRMFEAGKAYGIIIAFEEDKVSTEVVNLDGRFTDWIAGDGDNKDKKVETATPQPYTGTPDGLSNAYIVAPGGTVTFPVSRAYTYDEGAQAFTNTLRVGGTYDEEFEMGFVWADANADDLLEPFTIKGSGKNALVAVKAKAGASGNAVVALKKKDTEEIVWSYHIWVTSYDPEIPTLQYINPSNDVVFMDRNLGASDAGSKYSELTNAGLYYQWGRKDPFPATGAPDESQAEGSFTAETSSEEKGLVAYTIKNPGTFLINAVSSTDWLYTADDELWSKDGVKTVYDPCPAGWRVPVHGGTEATSPWYGFVEEGTTTPANTIDGFDEGYSWDDNAQYPTMGRRHRNSGIIDYAIGRGLYWAASSYDGGALALYFGNNYANVIFGDGRALGFSVRCVKE